MLLNNRNKLVNNMSIALPSNIDPDLIEDFSNEFEEAYEFCETKLVDLESDPENEEMINQLFRSIHTVKGNFTFVGLGALTPLLQSVEDILTKIRNNEILFNSSLSDIILLSMDQTKIIVDEFCGRGDSGLEMSFIDQAYNVISRVAKVSDDEREDAIADAILFLDPKTAIAEEQKEKKDQAYQIVVESRLSTLLGGYKVAISDDIKFFIDLIKPIENRSPFWSGRSVRLLLMALGINRVGGNTVDATQLTVAVLMHDISMAFLPLEVLHKKSVFSTKDKELIQQHSRSCFEMLDKMQHWDEAAQIVYQHHERVDGKGYPEGLTEEQINDGAKILAIIDAFDAITQSRAYSTKIKRPFIRAVLEINSQVDTQFSSLWVERFNIIVKKLHHHGMV